MQTSTMKHLIKHFIINSQALVGTFVRMMTREIDLSKKERKFYLKKKKSVDVYGVSHL